MFYRYLIPPQGWLTAKQSCTKVVRSNSSQVFIKCLLFFYQNIAFCLGWRKRIWVRRQLLLKLPLLEALQLELGWCRWALALAMRGTAIWPFCHHFVTRPSKQSGTSFGAPWVLIIFCGGFFLKKMIFFWISGWHRTTWQGTLPNRTTPSEGPSDCSTWLLHDKLSQKNHDTGMFSWWKHIKNYGEVKSDKKGAHTHNGMEILTPNIAAVILTLSYKAIFGDVFEAVGLETDRRLAVKVTELEKMRLQAFCHWNSWFWSEQCSNPGWLFDIGDYTTQLYGDNKEPI